MFICSLNDHVGFNSISVWTNQWVVLKSAKTKYRQEVFIYCYYPGFPNQLKIQPRLVFICFLDMFFLELSPRITDFVTFVMMLII